MKRITLILPVLALLAAPHGAEAKRKKDDRDLNPPALAPRAAAGLDRIMGKDMRTVMGYLGRPVLNVLENDARKMQFANRECILDVYLYPPSAGREPVVTYVTARVPDGRDAEKNSCFAALSRG